MSTPAHTPGPWFIDGENPMGIRTRELELVATVRPNRDHGVANGLLISAAPDLLDVVKRLLREDEADEFTIGLIEDARAALKKAEGDE